MSENNTGTIKEAVKMAIQLKMKIVILCNYNYVPIEGEEKTEICVEQFSDGNDVNKILDRYEKTENTMFILDFTDLSIENREKIKSHDFIFSRKNGNCIYLMNDRI